MAKAETAYLQGAQGTNPDILDAAVRNKIISEIKSDENISRKRFEQRKFDIYRNRQAPYVVERLRLEFSEKTVQSMRKVLSINPCKRIVDQMGSIYSQEPLRNFSGIAKASAPTKKPIPPDINSGGSAPGPVSIDPNVDPEGAAQQAQDIATQNAQADQEQQAAIQAAAEINKAAEAKEQSLQDIYHYCGINPQLRLANRYYKLCDQAALYIVPRKGKVVARALTPKDYDVLPDADDPEKAFGYVLNVFDNNFQGVKDAHVKEEDPRYYQNARADKDISNDADRTRKLERFVWWTDDNHFTTDGNGEIIPDANADENDDGVSNPIGRLPFVDIANEKDFQFFVKRGNNVAEFTIDLLTQFSDLAEVSRLQGYSQAIIYSHEEPKDLTVGPNKVMWIKLPKDGQQSQPKFAFESPTPDLANALEIINVQLKMFLSSNGLDASTVSGDTPKRAFTSGIDHLLANIDKFQASQEDIDLFRCVEEELWAILKLWLNLYQDVSGDDALIPELADVGKIDDDIDMDVVYPEPAIVQSQTEKEDSVIKRWDNSLLTTKDAVKELYDFDDEKAEEYIIELQADVKAFARPALPAFGALDAAGKPAVAPGAPAPGGAPAKPGGPPAPANKDPKAVTNVMPGKGVAQPDAKGKPNV